MVRKSGAADRVIVIGSGPAGASAALFLARAGHKPLVMEAGSQRTALGFTARVGGFTIAKWKRPQRQTADVTNVGDPTTELYEELQPGGMSNHWACAVPRFAADDFRDAERAGPAFAWPISYADLAPWYARVEPLLNIAAGVQDSARLPSGNVSHPWALSPEWQAVAAASEESGRSTVVMPYANGASSMVTRSATAFNAYSQLLLPALRRGELEIRYDAQVRELVWSGADNRVVAVVYRDARSGREERVPCRAVVLAAGALRSPQILLQSSSAEFPHGLGNAHDVLGRYLHDHPLAKLVVRLNRAVHIHPASYITRETLARSEPLYAAAFMQWCGSPALARSLLEGQPGKSNLLGFSVFGTMAPSADDFVALDRARAGALGTHRLRVRLQHPPEARATLERARDALMHILTRAGLDPRIAVWKLEAPGNSVHYGGTCRMHASPQYGVVDGWSRVHGVRNVAVADSSVFTTGPEKNPVLTAMTLAARASARLAHDLDGGDL